MTGSYGRYDIRELRSAMNLETNTDVDGYSEVCNLIPISEERSAVRSGDIEAVKKLVKDSDMVKKLDVRRWTLLHETAVHDRYAEIAQYFLSLGAKTDYETREKMTPFYIACKYGCERIARLFLEAGCDVSPLVKYDIESDYHRGPITPLHIACAQDNPAIIQLLVEHKACLDALDGDKCSPIYYALRHANTVAARILIENGAKLNVQNERGETPLRFACILGNEEMVNILLEYIGPDKSILNDQTFDGSTLLMTTIQRGHFSIAKKLIECGADTTILNGKELALHYAAAKGFKFFELLLDRTPVDLIETCASKTGSSLPCYIIESRDIRSLELLYEFGFSDGVLRCLDNRYGVVSPVCFLLLFIHFGSTIETELMFLDLLLFHESQMFKEELCRHPKNYPIDKYKMFSEEKVDLFQALFKMHTSDYHRICHCETIRHFVIKRLDYSRQILLFNKSAQNGSIGALSFLKYTQSVDAEDVLDAYLEYILGPEYLWNGCELNVFQHLHEQCLKNYSTTILNILNSLKEPTNDDKGKYDGFLKIYEFSKTERRLYSLKGLCRHPSRKYIREQCPDSQPFDSFLHKFASTKLPASISRYLLSREDF